MGKKTISISQKMKSGILDDNYTLYDDGTILHKYDRHTYPDGKNLKESLTVADLSDELKQRLLEAAIDENKESVRKILNL